MESRVWISDSSMYGIHERYIIHNRKIKLTGHNTDPTAKKQENFTSSALMIVKKGHFFFTFDLK